MGAQSASRARRLHPTTVVDTAASLPHLVADVRGDPVTSRAPLQPERMYLVPTVTHLHRGLLLVAAQVLPPPLPGFVPRQHYPVSLYVRLPV